MEEKELVIINKGKKETCVRVQGSSVVDVTKGTIEAMSDIIGWEEDTETETLSDHRYIKIRAERSEAGKYREGGRKIFSKWNTKKCDKEWFDTSMVCSEWLNEVRFKELIDRGEVDTAERTRRAITDACDNSMKRENGGKYDKSKVYWWNVNIAEIRGRCSMRRRRLTIAKCRKDPEQVAQLAGILKENRMELRETIGKAKKEAWNEPLDSTRTHGDVHIKKQ